jgi:homoserine O-acetyltransferase
MSGVLKPEFTGDFTLSEDAPLELENGGALHQPKLRYALYGRLNAARDNAVLVCHALTGSACVAEWWPELVGPGRVFDTNRFCVIGVNVLGSCYGSTGPASRNPQTGRAYGPDFPRVTIGDIVWAQHELINSLGVRQLYAVVGGSIGGMQALEWAVRFPHQVARCVAIGAAPLPALGLAFNHLQREAIKLGGLSLARQLAMCSYKSPALFDQRHARRPNRQAGNAAYDIGGYLEYQGDTFVKRFDADAYAALSRVMDDFSIARYGASTVQVLRRVRAKTLLVGISSDWLFPAAEVERLAQQFQTAGANVTYETFVSQHGHDAFLAEAAKLAPLVREFIYARQPQQELSYAVCPA